MIDMAPASVAWRKSSHSSQNGNCVEVGAWRKSTYSGQNGSCVEVGAAPGVVGVRDTKDRDGGHIAVPAAQWSAFLDGVKAGEFDRS